MENVPSKGIYCSNIYSSPLDKYQGVHHPSVGRYFTSVDMAIEAHLRASLTMIPLARQYFAFTLEWASPEAHVIKGAQSIGEIITIHPQPLGVFSVNVVTSQGRVQTYGWSFSKRFFANNTPQDMHTLVRSPSTGGEIPVHTYNPLTSSKNWDEVTAYFACGTTTERTSYVRVYRVGPPRAIVRQWSVEMNSAGEPELR